MLSPLATACLCLLVAHYTRRRAAIAIAGAAGLLAAAVSLFASVWTEGTQVLYVGGWAAPYGITLVADVFAVLMVLVAAMIHLVVSIYSWATVDLRRHRYGYFTFLNVMLMGVCGAFLTGDLFNLYVWFEVMLMGSFVLLVLGSQRAQLEAGLKYVALSLLSSALFLAGVGIFYGIAHTLNMAHLSERLALAAESDPWLVTSASLLLLLAFGIKAAIVPLHFWLPDRYHAPPPVVNAIFAALLTKTGVYAMVRVFTLVLPPSDYLFGLLGIMAGLTMVVGVLGAVSQMHIRRILSVHIISQIGYMIMGVALLGAPDPSTRRLAVAAAIFYIVHNMLVKTNLVLLSGTIRAFAGTEHLSRLGGLITAKPIIAALFLVSALSLAGLPPSSGFWAKLGILQAGFHAEAYVLTATALCVGLLTLLSMIKIWSEVFWKPAPEEQADAAHVAVSAASVLLLGPIALLVLLSVVIGLHPQPLLTVTDRASAELLDRENYIAAVRNANGGFHAATLAEGVTP